MIGVEALTRIVEACLTSAYLANERPLSLLVIAKAGLGKTELVQQFSQTDGVYYCTDVTPYTILKECGSEIKSGKIKHIVIPDLLSIVNKSPDASSASITFFNSLIEEGLMRVKSRNISFEASFPVRVGLITTLAQQDYAKRMGTWAAMGFISRLIPIRFRYSQKTADDVLQSILRKEYWNQEVLKIKFPKPSIIAIPSDIGEALIALAVKLKGGDDELGARKLKQISVFVEALALMNGRNVVTHDELEELISLAKFMRPPQMIATLDKWRNPIMIENPDSYAEI